MGAWGPGIYENDDAADWVSQLERDGRTAVVRVLEVAASADGLDVVDASQAVAAADVVAHLRHHSNGDTGNSRVDDWLASQQQPIGSDLVSLALAALGNARGTHSELRGLWIENAVGFSEWSRTLEDLGRRLSNAPPPASATSQKRELGEWKPNAGDLFALPITNDRGWALGLVAESNGLQNASCYFFDGHFLALPSESEALAIADTSRVVTWKFIGFKPFEENRWRVVGSLPEFDLREWPEIAWSGQSAAKDPSTGRLSLEVHYRVRWELDKRRKPRKIVEQVDRATDVDHLPGAATEGFIVAERRISELLTGSWAPENPDTE